MIGSVLSDGAVLARRYRLESRIAAGGMASVWLAHDQRLHRPVAVKVIADTLAADHRYRQRFAREARAAAAVSHPSIVPIYDYGVHDVRPFLVMEYVDGGSLADLFAGRRSVALDGVQVARWMLSALDCIHRAGIVHRDIKPANILLDTSGHPRLTDFGIARPEDAESLTQTGMVVGTLRYMPPEVSAGGQALPVSDLYATGVVLRELTVHQPAPQLEELIDGLTATEPGNRPASARDALRLLEASERATRSAPGGKKPTTATRPITQATVPLRPAERVVVRRRVPPRALVAALVALVIAVVVVVSVSGGGSSSQKTTVPQPAPAGVPLNEQLQALGQLVDQAARK